LPDHDIPSYDDHLGRRLGRKLSIAPSSPSSAQPRRFFSIGAGHQRVTPSRSSPAMSPFCPVDRDVHLVERGRCARGSVCGKGETAQAIEESLYTRFGNECGPCLQARDAG
jgi:hypothetical protein